MSYSGHLLVESRNGLIVDAEVFQANGIAERDAALVMMERLPGTQPLTVGGDKGFDTHGFVEECRNLHVTPHVAHRPNCMSDQAAIQQIMKETDPARYDELGDEIWRVLSERECLVNNPSATNRPVTLMGRSA